MRKLASLRRIDTIKPIENADAIEVAVVDGWEVVVKKNEFKEGERVLYLEIDSWVPHNIAPFLSKGANPRSFNGVQGERLRTIKLRGQVSQGLILPDSVVGGLMDAEVGDDLTDVLGVQKWEAPIHASLQGQVKGSFPEFVRKTDQERVQNLIKAPWFFEGDWEVSLKLDGSSMTIFIKDEEIGVCSRNMWLKDNEENDNNSFIKMARKLEYDRTVKLVRDLIGYNFAVQGELMGPGIQGNREDFGFHRFFIFDVFNIETGEYVSYKERARVAHLLASFNEFYEHSPMLEIVIFNQLNVPTMESFLKMADIPSFNHKIAEGIVFKRLDGLASFKVINNKFLLKGGD